MAVVQGIADDLGVAPAQAEEIYRIYLSGDLSDTARKHFDALMVPLTAQFARALDKANIRGFTYLDAPRDLPFKLPYHRRRAVIENVPIDALLKKFGFSGSYHGEITPRLALRYLAPFFALYFDNNRSELNDLLQRKLHWLG
jgi:hypothetical protein